MIQVLLPVLVLLVLVALGALVLATRRHRMAVAALEQRLRQAEEESRQQRTRADGLAEDRARLEARTERLGVLEARIADLEGQLREAAELRLVAERRGAELESRLEEQARAADERLKELQDARERMRLEFQSLAAKIMEENSQRLGERQTEQLGHLLNPLREQIGDFRKLVSESYEKEGRERTVLQTELKQLLSLNQKLSDEARSLTRALTTDNRTQGYWGELKLERLLESAGLEKGQQYLTQESYKDAEGDRYRPDAVLVLPEDRHIVIDAKMNLVDYQRACDAVGDEEREACMLRHATAMRTHMRQLGEKDYSRLQGLNSPELVLMFIPVEAAFLEAVRRDSSLYDDAFARKIVLVGPSNLLASLQLVAQMWRTEQQNRNTQKIMERAASLYDKFVGFVGDLEKVRTQFATAGNTLDGAYAKLATGRGNLVRRAEELRRLGISPGKRLGGPLVEQAGAGEDDDEPVEEETD
ncbi:DNA recombination protein RmuC [Alkalisalibacterium limincola]|uniref:DNA recombination protein RmuC n=1 Tax=Alkalisalibacterium limincola TaxID=2699169 RepID=A0A5C8KY20_9GAMM|nr:DNA recombination protein RmuC [Alkalisalibacterium limincola]TXK65697.1 DNA recombination protein RmuC [Alkalisalibacterium limincola]